MKKTIIGFTLVELLVIIGVIGILASITAVGMTKVQQSARDNQRKAQVSLIAEALEKYYEKNGIYPSCSDLTIGQTQTVVNNTLPTLNQVSLTAPNATSGVNSVQSCSDLTAGNFTNAFSYVVSSDRYSWSLEYVSEVDGSIVTISNRHHSTGSMQTYLLSTYANTGGTVNVGGRYNAGTVLTITATPNTGYTFTSWSGTSGCSGSASHTVTLNNPMDCTATFTPNTPTTPVLATVQSDATNVNEYTTVSPVTCPSGSTAQYSFSHHESYNLGIFNTYAWSAYSNWSDSTTYTISASKGYQYGFTVMARCTSPYTSSASSPTSAEATDIYPMDWPSTAPTMTSPSYFTEDVYKQVKWQGYCPAYATYTSQGFPGYGYYTNDDWHGTKTSKAWGSNDRWSSGGDKVEIDYYGQYRCKTDFWETSNSPTSPKVVKYNNP